MSCENLAEGLTVEQRLDLYKSCTQTYPDPDPVREFGEFVPDPRDTFGQLELAQSLVGLQGMTSFLSVHTAPIGNGLGFVVVGFTPDKGIRKVIFESAWDAERFITEVRDAIDTGAGHWFSDKPSPYMKLHRDEKKRQAQRLLEEAQQEQSNG